MFMYWLEVIAWFIFLVLNIMLFVVTIKQMISAKSAEKEYQKFLEKSNDY
jgi:vancomycin permeability regulator SanA